MTKRKPPLAREQVSQIQLHLCRWHNYTPQHFIPHVLGETVHTGTSISTTTCLNITSWLSLGENTSWLPAMLQLLFMPFQVNAVWTKDMGKCFKKSHWDHQPISKMSLSNMLNLTYITSTPTTHFPNSGLGCCEVQPNPIWIYFEIYLVDTTVQSSVHDLMVWNTTVLPPVWFYFTSFTSLC